MSNPVHRELQISECTKKLKYKDDKQVKLKCETNKKPNKTLRARKSEYQKFYLNQKLQNFQPHKLISISITFQIFSDSLTLYFLQFLDKTYGFDGVTSNIFVGLFNKSFRKIDALIYNDFIDFISILN